MVAPADLYELPTRSGIKATIIGYAEAAQLKVTSWILGDPSERWIEIGARMVDGFASNTITMAVRSMFFDYSTDPGDAGDLSADQTPRPGWLSAFMSGWWGVQRGNATYARTIVEFTNDSGAPITLVPFDLTVQRSTAASDGGYPTYRNDVDDSIYTSGGGALIVADGATVEIPIIADQIGSYANASPGEISVVVTQSFGTVTVTNPSAARGSDREDRSTAIARAKQQSAAASPNGPADAYRYASTTGADGNPLQLWDGSGETTVNRVYVSPDSTTGEVLIYLANPSGAATAVEVSSANGNINGLSIAATDGTVYNADPIGVVPDTVSLGPTIVDATTGAPGPAAATPRYFGPIAGTARIKAVPGQTSATLTSAVHDAINDAHDAFFASPDTAPIGGMDQVLGAGVIYTSDIQNATRDAYPVPAAGQVPAPTLYGVDIDVPSGSTSVISLGNVPVLRGQPTISAVAGNGGGFTRLTVSSTTGIVSGSDAQFYDVVISGLALAGTYPVTVINGTTLDLLTLAWPGAASFTSAKMSMIVVTVVS